MTFAYVRRWNAALLALGLALNLALAPATPSVVTAAGSLATAEGSPSLTVPATSAQLAVADGELLQVTGDEKIHVIQEGRRRWIADTSSLQALNPNYSRLRRVTFDELDSVPVGRPFRQLPLIRDRVSGRVYLLTRETGDRTPRKHWINDLESFSRLGFEWGDVAVDWPTPPERYPDAPALTYRPPVKTEQAWVREGETLRVIPAWRLQTEDDQLYLALALSNTYNQEWSERIAPKLAGRGSWIEWGDLPRAVGGRYHTGLNRVTIARALQGESVGVVASVLSHEALHAVTEHGTGVACYQEEIEAFGIGARTWSGLPAKWRSTSEWGRSLDRLVDVWRMGNLEHFVGGEAAYQQQCR